MNEVRTLTEKAQNAKEKNALANTQAYRYVVVRAEANAGGMGRQYRHRELPLVGAAETFARVSPVCQMR